MMTRLIISLFIASVILGCSKDKKFSKRLSGENWEVISLKIDNEPQEDLPNLSFDECNIYKETCFGKWSLNSNEANFAWQLREKTTIFEISNQSLVTAEKEAEIIQCMNLSGIYEVLAFSKSEFKIKSNTTVGYGGTDVEILLKKN